VESGRVDYDARQRDELLEKSRSAASDRIRLLIRRLRSAGHLLEDRPISVRNEADCWLSSSIGRELQTLSSHTIHHFALISAVLTLHGIDVDPDFGMSPSTLRFNASQFAATR
jgi:hypothetical protein